jgi:hypothetical protein
MTVLGHYFYGTFFKKKRRIAITTGFTKPLEATGTVFCSEGMIYCGSKWQ